MNNFMLASLDGTVKKIDESGAIISVQGIGFKVALSQFSRSKLPPEGESTSLWIETVIRAENIQLCGFISQFEQYCFQKLIQVQGVGVRAALAILSVCSADSFYSAVSEKNTGLIEKASGVGKKLAQRIILELHGKLLPHPDMNHDFDSAVLHSIQEDNSHTRDANDALIQLGYAPARIKPIIAAIVKAQPEVKTEDIIRISLQKLAGM